MWPRLVNTALGIWLMAAPAVLGYGGAARINDLIVGPIAANFAIVAIWEATRPLRWINFALGLWLLVAPWILSGYEPRLILHSMAVGALMAGLALIRGRISQRFGGGWSALWRKRGESVQAD